MPLRHLCMVENEMTLNNTVNAPTTVRLFASDFFFSHLWHNLMCPRSSVGTASFHWVVRDGEAVQACLWKVSYHTSGSGGSI